MEVLFWINVFCVFTDVILLGITGDATYLGLAGFSLLSGLFCMEANDDDDV